MVLSIPSDMLPTLRLMARSAGAISTMRFYGRLHSRDQLSILAQIGQLENGVPPMVKRFLTLID